MLQKQSTHIIHALLLLIANSFMANGQKGFSLAGTLTENVSGIPLTDAHVYLHELEKGTVSDSKGRFRFEGLKAGRYHLHITLLGYAPRIEDVLLNDNTDLGTLRLSEAGSEMRRVEIEDSRFRTTKEETAQSITVLDRDFLDRNPASTLSGMLTKVPGVQAVTTGTGIAKPLIRGLGFNRVAVAEYGLKQEGQQWGADHGLEIDQYNVERVEIIKGPGSLIYGSDAMSGIINIKPVLAIKPDMLQAGGLFTYRSNNDLFGYSAHAALQKKGVLFKARFSGQDYGDYRVPADNFTYNSYKLPIFGRRLKNTAGRERNASLTLGLMKNWGYSTLSASFYQLQAGFFPGAHGIPNVNDLSQDESARNLDLPRQEVKHFKVVSNSNINLKKHWLEVDFGYQLNLRGEYSEPHTHGMAPTPVGNKEFGFALHTLSGNVKFHHHILSRLNAIYGINGQYRQNKTDGYSFLIPDFSEYGIGAYAFFKYDLSAKNVLTGGIRYDYAHINSRAFYRTVYENGVPSGAERAAPEIDRSFGNVSGAVGISILPREDINVKINVGSSYRLPTAIELTANGIHHGSLRHEKGDSTLTPERGLQLDLSLVIEKEKIDISVSPFFNYFFGYIYLNPTAEFSPLPEAGLLWKYTQNDGLHTGVEFLVDYHPVDGLHLNVGGQMVYTYSPITGYNFPMIPPIGGHAEVEYELDIPGKWIGESFAGIELRWAAPQFLNARNELFTPGYAVFNWNMGTRLTLKNQSLKLHFSIQNLFNTRYFNHLSNWRRIGLPEPGRNFLIGLTIPLEIKI